MNSTVDKLILLRLEFQSIHTFGLIIISWLGRESQFKPSRSTQLHRIRASWPVWTFAKLQSRGMFHH